MSVFTRSLSILALAAVPVLAQAQDVGMGQQEYMNACAQCHGALGKGDGVMSGFLNNASPDLTGLQEANGGVFPVVRLFSVIEGSNAAGIHGTSDMPAWGDRYRVRAEGQLGYYYTQNDQEAFVRGRILALIEYISTLQEK